MKIVGLTGGIGSGKTTVAKMFAELGVPIYIADDEAKKIVDSDTDVKRALIKILGAGAYNKSGMNRPFVANLVFNDKKLLQKINGIIHPKVGEHFEQWALGQEGAYCIKEAAILFENGGYKNCDLTILVTAPTKIRVQRILNRDDTTEELIRQRMENQWSDAEKKKLADMIIVNVDLEQTKKEVVKIHKKLSKPQ